MHSKLRILVAGRAKPALEKLAASLRQDGSHEVDSRHMTNGHADPLFGLSHVPDLVVFVLTEKGHQDLSAISKEQASVRPPMIVIAEHGDAQTMRLAMQAGARDFLPGIVSTEDLLASIDRASAQIVKSVAERGGLTAFVNAKGGSGATFIACNIAHMLTTVSKRSAALLSLDMQFNSLAHYFDAKLRHGLLQVLETVDDLDAVALDAYLTQHESGLRIIGAIADRGFGRHAEKPAQLSSLLQKMTAHYQQVVVDMPRRIDGYTGPVLEHATRVVLVVQQTLSHLHDASRMLQIFRDYGVEEDRVFVVVNRFEKGSPLGIADIQKALKDVHIVTVPSNFKVVAESINLGIPMYEHAKGSSVTKALMALETRLGGSAGKSEGLFGRAFSNLLRKDSWSQT
jgi:pilus assembly protein CpaE